MTATPDRRPSQGWAKYVMHVMHVSCVVAISRVRERMYCFCRRRIVIDPLRRSPRRRTSRCTDWPMSNARGRCATATGPCRRRRIFGLSPSPPPARHSTALARLSGHQPSHRLSFMPILGKLSSILRPWPWSWVGLYRRATRSAGIPILRADPRSSFYDRATTPPAAAVISPILFLRDWFVFPGQAPESTAIRGIPDCQGRAVTKFVDHSE